MRKGKSIFTLWLIWMEGPILEIWGFPFCSSDRHSEKGYQKETFFDANDSPFDFETTENPATFIEILFIKLILNESTGRLL